MKLFICIVHNHYRDVIEKGLNEQGYRMTELSSTGSFRRRGNTTFLIGAAEQDAENVKELMKELCTEQEKKKPQPDFVTNRFVSFLIDVNDVRLFTENSPG
ncbi:cyclic-di-AMP receptor [Salisediminibacterium halotolerans]|uniref:cyclic-di-AMP receptor n=1 Tax=Salisediminibacterium halotolerans TaxID=517425 RepID=UPI000EB59B22|nr:cyclic-di-AMP receptor [Salisediminibacterium halotolerans]RLJ69221.1 uncharacterized protein YaaQ [Actinophytocola xinjiangensis]RPE87044.1 uncharacterized protein YaaQ [Salisediminibacterium halotolerans]TWG32223.1 uncharacterized protein YaaQ [Salisediminibacterium halotolerans]GEL09212.1 hypothetical protein SHA02_26280 [Salisediminibacterium halotolerans]